MDLAIQHNTTVSMRLLQSHQGHPLTLPDTQTLANSPLQLLRAFNNSNSLQNPSYTSHAPKKPSLRQSLHCQHTNPLESMRPPSLQNAKSRFRYLFNSGTIILLHALSRARPIKRILHSRKLLAQISTTLSLISRERIVPAHSVHGETLHTQCIHPTPALLLLVLRVLHLLLQHGLVVAQLLHVLRIRLRTRHLLSTAVVLLLLLRGLHTHLLVLACLLLTRELLLEQLLRTGWELVDDLRWDILDSVVLLHQAL